MNRRQFLYAAGSAGALAAACSTQLESATMRDAAQRGLRIVVDEHAPDAVLQIAQTIANAQDNALLSVLRGKSSSPVVTSRELLAAPIADRALNHLIVVGQIADPIVGMVWQREARSTPHGIYIFGFGELGGDIGYIESDRNLFLHSSEIAVAPFETEIVTITGTTVAGLRCAAEAFLQNQLINGVVAPRGWSRSAQGLLDRDPLPQGFELPRAAPDYLKGYARIGLTQASEDEYRGVLADTLFQPASIWRVKYYSPGVWDGEGATTAFDAYSTGLHRRAYGNARWVATFASAGEAEKAAPRIAAAAQLTRTPTGWNGLQPYYANPQTPGSEHRGPLVLWQDGAMLLMSTIPGEG